MSVLPVSRFTLLDNPVEHLAADIPLRAAWMVRIPEGFCMAELDLAELINVMNPPFFAIKCRNIYFSLLI